MSHLSDELARVVQGDVTDSPELLERFSRDTSIFWRHPSCVVAPQDAADLAALVSYVAQRRREGVALSLTARSGGTDMTGGPLTDSIVVSFTPHMNRVLDIGSDYAVVEPGAFYRDFEKQTLEHNGKLLPSYPASREICCLGGIIANNSGGELTLKYGKTEKYVGRLRVVLSDGSRATFEPQNADALAEKKKEQTLEGVIYREMHELITKNRDIILKSRPKVSKNSSGYALWNAENLSAGTFDLSQLIVGSQGTLALVTEAKLNLVRPKQHKAMLIIFLKDLNVLPDVVHRVLNTHPESFESYDNHTFTLAIRFLPQLLKNMGIWGAFRLGASFAPEMIMTMTGGVPRLVLMAEFAEDSAEQARDAAKEAQVALKELDVATRLALGDFDRSKYWKVRREGFNILRKTLPNLYAAPFIDDCVVNPEVYPQFLPELETLLSKHSFTFAIQGHIGNGNFHIFPLVDMSKPEVRKEILEVNKNVYELVLKFGGSITGEHNDGIIRTPYVKQMFGDEMYALFEKTKQIFDPLNIFNPGKKVGGTMGDIEHFMMKSSR